MYGYGPTVKCGIAEFQICFLFHEKNIIAAITHSKRRSLYGSAYRWIVNTLTLTKCSLGIVYLVSPVR